MEFDYSLQPGRTLRKKPYVKGVKPLISIITPFFNAGKFFNQTYNSVLNQSFPWFEWIIVNDGSTNKNELLELKQLAAADSRIRVVDQDNSGLSAARNRGFHEATTEIVVPLDADDLLEPGYLECVFWALFLNQNSDWAYTDSVGFSAEEYLWKNPWNSERMKVENILVATAAIRKSAFEEVGGYRVEKLHFNEDWCFWLEMLAHKKEPVHVNGYVFWYRRTAQGMLATIRRNKRQLQFSKHVIKDAASKVTENISAVEYPTIISHEPFHIPKVLSLGEEYVIPHTSKKRILMMIPWMVVGGADMFNLNLISNLDSSKYEVSVICTVPSENGLYQQFAEKAWDTVILPNFLDPAYYFEFISYYIKSREIDLIMVTNSMAGYYMLPLIRKHFPTIPVVDYVHMEEWYWKAGGYARASGVMAAYLDKTYLCNSATRQVMMDYFHRKPESVKTIHIGVDHNFFDPKMVEKGMLYKLTGIPSSKKIILFPCRIHPQKRPLMLLDIAEAVCAENQNVVFVVVGDGELLPELKEQIRLRNMNNCVICIGQSSKMREFYQDAYLTLICSIKEGLSLTAYESCAMGVPVISSDVGGQKDLIDDSCGALVPCFQNERDILECTSFPQNEVYAFSKAILNFLLDEELYERCSCKCREKIESHFCIRYMAEMMDAEFKECIDQLRDIPHISQPFDGYLEEELFVQYVDQLSQETVNALLWDVCLPGSSDTQKRQFLKKRILEMNFNCSKSLLRKVADFVFPLGSSSRKKLKSILSKFPILFQKLRAA